MNQDIKNNFKQIIQADLKKDKLVRDYIFIDYLNYLELLVKDNDLDATLQYASVLNEINVEYQNIIVYLESKEEMYKQNNQAEILSRYYANLASFYTEKDGYKKNSKAEQYIKLAMTIHKNQNLYSMLGHINFSKKNYEEALVNFENAHILSNKESDLLNIKILELINNKSKTWDSLKVVDFDSNNIQGFVSEITTILKKPKAKKIYLYEDCYLTDCVIHNN